MTPEFCKKCRHLSIEGGCMQYKKCAGWQRWFHEEWESIRRAAQKIKEQNSEEGEDAEN